MMPIQLSQTNARGPCLVQNGIIKMKGQWVQAYDLWFSVPI